MLHEVTVAVGRLNATGKYYEDYQIESAFHAGYTNSSIPMHDIALVKLNVPIPTTSASSLCLPHHKGDNPVPGSKCWVAGWGETCKYHATKGFLDKDSKYVFMIFLEFKTMFNF